MVDSLSSMRYAINVINTNIKFGIYYIDRRLLAMGHNRRYLNK